MIEFYKLLKQIEPRPALWTGENSLKSIRTFLNGYSFALTEHKLIETLSLKETNFHDWVASRLGYSESTAGWDNMILASTIGIDLKHISWENFDVNIKEVQHKESILKFYELLEEYIEDYENDF
ncbi:hypothetical protein [Winogradskyella helgolandensis]|uniref:hypothetical protein n=1 Tax=Winogradskyella helgolandensis TaxID=2697010 RepID=UPI0015BDC4B8|nr:hypothetical protein [Winogradskyella helgolandensis]